MRKFTDEIEKNSNIFLEDTLQKLFIEHGLKLKSYPYSVEKGIDFNFEIENREVQPNTIGWFFLQNKGVDTPIKPLKSGENKGRISFKLDDYRQVLYFCSEVEQPLIITICDLKSRTIYWEPIQLSTEEYLSEIEKIKDNINQKQRKGKSIQIYIDPERTLIKDDNICFENFIRFYSEIEISLDYITIRNLERKNSFSDDTDSIISVDKEEPILNQLYTYLSTRFKEITTLPAKFWANAYPFKQGASPYFSYGQFCLYTDNKEVWDFFSSITISGEAIYFNNLSFIEGVSDFKEKTIAILKILNSNLVYNIEYNSTADRVSIQYNKHYQCDCVQCSYNELNFKRVAQNLLIQSNDINEVEKQAYIHYELGNFVKSAELFLEVETFAIRHKQNLKSFIVKYNLSHLSKFIKFNFSNEAATPELIKRLEKAKNSLESGILYQGKDKRLLKWIKEGYFFYDTQLEVTEQHVKLKDFYFSQLYGGKGSNSFVWNIYTESALLDCILNNNHIVYDNYTEYEQLSEVFVESIFVSYAVRESLNSRLEYFDDWIIRALIFNGRPEVINKYYYRHSVKFIKYLNNATISRGFMDYIRNFLSNNITKDDTANPDALTENYHFNVKYNNILGNLLVLASILDLAQEQLDEIAILLLEFLKTPALINYSRSSNYITQFIRKRGTMLKQSTLKSFLDLIYESSMLHEEEYIAAIADCYEQRNEGVVLTKSMFTKINKLLGNSCPLCNRRHEANMYVHFYRILNNEEGRNRIKEKIKSILDQEYSWQLYYLSTMYEVLEPKTEYFNQLIEYTPQKLRAIFFFNYSKEEENRDFRLGAIINICFKYRINLKSRRFSHFRGYDAYYDWLMDMETFDYSKFKPSWVSEHYTKYYKEMMRKFKQIKEQLALYLKSNNDPQLKNIFIQLYCDD